MEVPGWSGRCRCCVTKVATDFGKDIGILTVEWPPFHVARNPHEFDVPSSTNPTNRFWCAVRAPLINLRLIHVKNCHLHRQSCNVFVVPRGTVTALDPA